MRKRSVHILLALVVSSTACSQEALLGSDRTLYSKEMAGGLFMHSEGWGLQFIMGKYRTAKVRSLIGFEFMGLKHPKEVKSFNPFYEDSRGYFYGKENSVLLFHPSIGRKVQITDKMRKNGVEVNYFWNIGPSIALVKPVFLQVGYKYEDNAAVLGFPYEFIQDERYDPDVHFIDNIFGRSSWFRGFGQMQIEPGIFGRFGFNFEYDSENAGLRALEVGVTIDAFANKLPIMAFDPTPRVPGGVELNDDINKRIFVGFYVAAQMGRKFTR